VERPPHRGPAAREVAVPRPRHREVDRPVRQGGPRMSTQTTTLDAPGAQLVQQRIAWRTPIIYLVVGALAFVFFGLLTSADDVTRFTVSTSRDFVTISPFDVPSKLVGLVLSVLALALAGWATFLTRERRKVPTWVP